MRESDQCLLQIKLCNSCMSEGKTKQSAEEKLQMCFSRSGRIRHLVYRHDGMMPLCSAQPIRSVASQVHSSLCRLVSFVLD